MKLKCPVGWGRGASLIEADILSLHGIMLNCAPDVILLNLGDPFIRNWSTQFVFEVDLKIQILII